MTEMCHMRGTLEGALKAHLHLSISTALISMSFSKSFNSSMGGGFLVDLKS